MIIARSSNPALSCSLPSVVVSLARVQGPGMSSVLMQIVFSNPRPSYRVYRGSVARCGPAPLRPKPHKPRVADAFEAVGEQVQLDKHTERKLRELLGEPGHHKRGGAQPRTKEVEFEALGLLINGVRHAGSGSEVALWLRSAVREGMAGPKLVTAALDRLKDLHQRRPDKQRKEAEPALMAACELAMEQGMACLAGADLWMLCAMARTPYWLYYAVPPAHQALITDAFLCTLEAAPGAGAGAGPATQQGEEGTAAAAASGAQQGNSGSRGQGEVEQFVWATFSSTNWHMSGEQRAALMRHAREHPSDAAQHSACLLVALVRLESFAGPEAVAPFLADGTLALIVDRIMSQLEQMDAQQCQTSLLSAATLRFHWPLGALAALLEHLLAVVDSSDRPVDVIAKTFKALALLHHAATAKYDAVLQLPAARGLCRRFVELAAEPSHRGKWLAEWDCMLRACTQMRYDPPVGPAGERLFEVLLSHLPELAPRLTPFDSTHALLGMGAYYGVPVAGKLAPALRPYRKHLAGMALRAQAKLALFVAKKNTWDVCTEQHVRDVVGAFAALGKA